MQQILLHYEISAEFLPILYSFGDAPNAAEGSSSNIAVDWPKQSATPLEKTQRARSEGIPLIIAMPAKSS